MPNNYEEEQSTIYLSAMLQELKNSLKERQALRAARLGLTISEDQVSYFSMVCVVLALLLSFLL